MKTKENFHKLIDTIDDEHTLNSYFKLVQLLNTDQSGKLWNDLDEKEKQELIVSYDESFNPDNIVSHNDIKAKYDKWLNK